MSRLLAPMVVAMQQAVARHIGLADGEHVSITLVTPFGECRHVARVRVLSADEMHALGGAVRMPRLDEEPQTS